MSRARLLLATAVETCARKFLLGVLAACLAAGIVVASHRRALAEPFLTADDVVAIIKRAAESIDAATMIIAVTDRAGNPLGVFLKPDAPITTPAVGNFGHLVNPVELAFALARTGTFLSNDKAPISSRTVRFLTGIHFPPGITNKSNAPLYGFENTNRGCELNTTFNPGKEIQPPKSVIDGIIGGLSCTSADRRGCGLGMQTGKADLFDSDPNAVNPGGVPIFKEGTLVGGIGVTGVSAPEAEFAAFSGSTVDPRFGPRPASPGKITIEGIILPFVEQSTPPPGAQPGEFTGTACWLIDAAPGFTCTAATPASTGLFTASPFGDAGVPTGWLVGPVASPELTAAEVERIVNQAVETASITRAAIRLPLGSSTRMVMAVGDLNGNILGAFRMPDATMFSFNVAVTKSRNVVYFSSRNRVPGDLPGVPLGTAISNRTINFGTQPLYPPGIDGTAPGPFFQVFVDDVALPCSQASDPPSPNQSGVVFFAGSIPLYKNGQLVGGLGISGDGVEQDDLVAAGGATGFAAPEHLRADQIVIRDVRLPFLKFFRNPFAR